MSETPSAADLIAWAQSATSTEELDDIESQANGRTTVLQAVAEGRERLDPEPESEQSESEESDQPGDLEPRTAQEKAEVALSEGRGPGMTEAEQAQFDHSQELAVAEIPNPGPVEEPQPQMQAFHAEQTDPPPGPYPDPPVGPYPDPEIKDRPSEEVVYGKHTPTRR